MFNDKSFGLSQSLVEASRDVMRRQHLLNQKQDLENKLKNAKLHVANLQQQLTDNQNLLAQNPAHKAYLDAFDRDSH